MNQLEISEFLLSFFAGSLAFAHQVHIVHTFQSNADDCPYHIAR